MAVVVVGRGRRGRHYTLAAATFHARERDILEGSCGQVRGVGTELQGLCYGAEWVAATQGGAFSDNGRGARGKHGTAGDSSE